MKLAYPTTKPPVKINFYMRFLKKSACRNTFELEFFELFK